MRNFIYWSLTALLLMGGISACSGGSDSKAAAQSGDSLLNVVTTTGMIADIAKNVGGEHVQVTSLMGPGVDPHLYKASAGDVNRLFEADIIFYNGLHLEASMGKVLERFNESGATTVAVAEAIDPEKLQAPPEFEGFYDPHVWFNVAFWMDAATAVETALIEIDPDHADDYTANAQAYLAELAELDTYVSEQAARVPDDQRVLITAHDAFNYFGKAYGFEVRGLQGISTASEAGTADVQDLARFIAERRIPAIFVESSVPPRTVEAVQAAVRAQGFNVRIGGELFSDAMGSPGTDEGTYNGMVRHNIDTIVGALLGE
ncbi:MAG: metal ABC transporter solute-binding protein, Zn/Mn family [Candidatus Promineifilaceae bacterium]|jgi:manganese/zinc/iron transport system substrate-binding protein